MKRLSLRDVEILLINKKRNPHLREFIFSNMGILDRYRVITVDQGYHNSLSVLSDLYIPHRTKRGLFEARRLAIDKAKTKYAVVLDTDVIVPINYIETARFILKKHSKVGAVSLFYKSMKHRGVLEFGISVWRRALLDALYDYTDEKNKEMCECLYMWTRLHDKGFTVEQIAPYKAVHLRE